MLKLLKTLKEQITKLLNSIVIILVALLVLDVFLGVFSRHIMQHQVKWTEELARFLLIWVVLLGGAVAFGTKGHLGVDYFVEKFHSEAKKTVEVVVHLLVLFFAVSIFIYGGGQVVKDALQMHETTPALGWMMGYVYLALPISGCFMVLYTLENLIETIKAPCESTDDNTTQNEGGNR